MGINLPANVAEARLSTLRDIEADGAPLGTAEAGSVELLAYTTGMANPLARIGGGKSPLNTVGAVARFIWLVSGSDRLEDIAYYESKVRGYTDDDLSVPGSSYGKRIFNAAPGTNQMSGVVSELKERTDSRRAAAVVWLPEDAVRSSKDIPCTFGLFFHIREGGLIMTTVMRSNNAVVLLPYNFFEFSLLGELVAAELNVPFTRYVHWAASMHTVNAQNVLRDRVVEANDPTVLEMPAMPRGEALESAYAVARFEAQLRHASTIGELESIAVAARAELDEYWGGFFNVLYVYGLAKRGYRDAVRVERGSIPDHFALGAEPHINKVLGPEPLAETNDDGALFGYVEQVLSDTDAAFVAQNASHASDADWLLSTLRSLSDGDITLDDVIAVHESLVQRDYALAARAKGLPAELTPEDVAAALSEVLKKKASGQ